MHHNISYFLFSYKFASHSDTMFYTGAAYIIKNSSKN